MKGAAGVNQKIYSIDEIRETVMPIAKKYKLQGVYIFGSYARKTANENSDIDFLIDRENSDVREIIGFMRLYDDLKDAFNKDIDVVTLQSLQQKSTARRSPEFIQNVTNEMVKIYG